MAALEKEVVLRSGGPVMPVPIGQRGPTRPCYWPAGDDSAEMHEAEIAVAHLRLAFPHTYEQAFPPKAPRIELRAQDSLMQCSIPAMVVVDRFDDLLVECLYFDDNSLRRTAFSSESLVEPGPWWPTVRDQIDNFAKLDDAVVRARGPGVWLTPEQQAYVERKRNAAREERERKRTKAADLAAHLEANGLRPKRPSKKWLAEHEAV